MDGIWILKCASMVALLVPLVGCSAQTQYESDETPSPTEATQARDEPAEADPIRGEDHAPAELADKSPPSGVAEIPALDTEDAIDGISDEDLFQDLLDKPVRNG